FPLLHLVADLLFRADQRERIDKFVWNRGRGLLLLTVEEQVLDFLGRLAPSLTRDVIVVEVLAARAHAADVERNSRLQRIARRLYVVVHHEVDRRHDFKVAPALAIAGFLEPGFDIRHERLDALGRRPYRDETVGDFSGGLDALGRDRRRVDRD